MNKNFKKKIAVCLAGVLACSAFAASKSPSGTAAFVEGCAAYSQGDWASAMFMLKKAVAYPENANPDSYYMLISSEIYAGEDKSALDDCDFFLENYTTSLYFSRILYQKGRILYNLGEYEKSIIVLSDFCHEYKDDELYPFALYYIAESLFGGYKYSEAKEIYERIVSEFPSCGKATVSQYRIESIAQRLREEKLLYLLKQTGEEYLSTREEYEKQLRLYNSENVNSTRIKLTEAQRKNEELEQRVRELESMLQELKESNSNTNNSSMVYNSGADIPSNVPYDEQIDIRLLRIKAANAQRMLESQLSEEE